MAFSNRGRPANEVQNGDTYVVPFSNFGRVFSADDTTTLQKALDWSADTGLPVGQEGEFLVNGLVIKDRMKLICPGEKTTRIVPRTGSVEAQVISLAADVVQNVTMSGFRLTGNGISGQHGVHLRAVAGMATGFLQGGLWNFTFEDIEVTGFTGEGWWLDGGNNAPGDPAAFRAPIQMGSFRGVRVFNDPGSKRALRLSGQVGQVGFDERCEFDHFSPSDNFSGTAENILIERSVDAAGVQYSDIAPNTILFKGITCQGAVRGATVERSSGITFLGGHFENLREGILNSVSAFGNLVIGTDFANVGYRGDGSGWGVKNTGGQITVRDLKWLSSSPVTACETHYVSWFNQTLEIEGGHFDGTGIRTSGITRGALASTPTLTLDTSNNVYVNGPQSTPITTIDSVLSPGEILTLRANGGYIVIGDTGNIDPTPFRAPLRVPSGGAALLQRNDLSGVWKVIGLSGPQGHRYPDNAFVNLSLSPYQAIAGMGTIRVDASSGNVTIRLPSINDTGPGERITVKRIDGSSNTVFINGATSGENPDGQGTNVVRLTGATQSMTFERNGLVGTQGWDTVSDSSTASGTITSGAGTELSVTSNPSATQGQRTIWSSPSYGMAMRPGSGTVYDFSIWDAVGSGYIMGVTPGTRDIFFGGVVTVATRVSAPQFDVTSTTGYTVSGLLRIATSGPYATYFSPTGSSTTGALLIIGGTTDKSFYFDADLFTWRTLTGAATSVVLDSTGKLFMYRESIMIVVSGKGLVDSSHTVRVGVTSVGVTTTGVLTHNGDSGGIAINVTDAVGNTGISFTPLNSASGAFFDNRRVGAQTIFRTSNATSVDRTWLTVNSTGTVGFGFAVTINNVLTINTSTGATGIDIFDSASHSGISFTPAVGGSAFIDNGRVGSGMVFRVSTSSSRDKTWMTVSSLGVVVFPFTVFLNAGLILQESSGVRAVSIEDSVGNTGLGFKPAASGNLAFVDVTRNGAGIVFRVSNAGSADTTWLSVDSVGFTTFGQGIQTLSPAGGTAARWKLGSRVTAGVSTDFGKYIELDVGGTLYKLLTAI